MQVGEKQDGVSQLLECEIEIALARCAECGFRVRVLPGDVLARKAYALPVIEECCATRVRGVSLRRTVGRFHAHRPVHATVHAWTEGLGAHADGRDHAVCPGDSVGAVMVETTSRFPGVGGANVGSPSVASSRCCRSEPRRERLVAVGTLLMTARNLPFAEQAAPLTAWRLRAIAWTSTPFSFQTSTRYMRIEQPQVHAATSSCRDVPRPRARRAVSVPRRRVHSPLRGPDAQVTHSARVVANSARVQKIVRCADQ